MGGDGVLGGEAVAAAEDLHLAVTFGECRADVFKQRLADAAGFLGAVKDGNRLHGLRQCAQQMLCRERAVQMDLDHTNLLAFRGQVVHHFHHGLTDRTHCDNDAFGIGSAVVVEELVVSAGERVNAVHLLLHNLGQGIVGGVAGLTGLEEGIRILQSGADGRVLRVQRVILEALHSVPVEQLAQILIVQDFDLLELMGGAEPVKEVLEWDGTLDCGKMGYRGHVHTFLYTGGCQLGKASLAAGHHVALIAENGDRVGSDGAGRDMHDTRQHGARNTEHWRDHQHQALRCGESGGQGPCLQRTVHGTAGACLALELHQLYRLAEQVFLPVGSPVVNMVCHGTRRCDRIDRRDLGKRIRDV